MGPPGGHGKPLSSPSRSNGDFCSDGSETLLSSGAGRFEEQPSHLSFSQWIHRPEASPGYLEFLMRSLEMFPSPEMVGSPSETGTGSEHAYGALHETSSPETPHSYVEFLSESLAQVPHTGKGEMIGSLTVGSQTYDPISEVGTQLCHNDAPKPHRPLNDEGFSNKRSGKSIASSYTVSSIRHEDSATVRNQKPSYGGDCMNRSTSSKVEIGRQAKKYQLWGSEEDRKDYSLFPLHPDETTVAPYSLSIPHSSEPERRDCIVLQPHPEETDAATVRQKGAAQAAERLRRLRVSEGLKALQAAIPNSSSGKGAQAFIVDDTIDYVKFLQFQVKELCRSRLGSEPTSSPFVFLEGYGHYALHEQMRSEPLEEVIGTLLKTDPSAATQILAARGLYLGPLSLAGGAPRIP